MIVDIIQGTTFLLADWQKHDPRLGSVHATEIRKGVIVTENADLYRFTVGIRGYCNETDELRFELVGNFERDNFESRADARAYFDQNRHLIGSRHLAAATKAADERMKSPF